MSRRTMDCPAVLFLVAAQICLFGIEKIYNSGMISAFGVVPAEICTAKDFVGEFDLRSGDSVVHVEMLRAPLGVYTNLVIALFVPSNVFALGIGVVGLLVLGCPVERTLGTADFLRLFLFSGIVGNLAECFFRPMSLAPFAGSGSAVLGIFAALFSLAADDLRRSRKTADWVFAITYVLFAIAILPEAVLAVLYPSQVPHWAQFCGALAGRCWIRLWCYEQNRTIRSE